MEINERWAISYFESCVRDILGPYFVSLGFHEMEPATFQEVAYLRRHCKVTVHYIAEEPRPHSPMVSIGVPMRRGLARSSEIGLWRAIPEDAVAYDYASWRFDNADQLHDVLKRIRNEVLEPYGRPLWENPDRIEMLAQEQLREIKAEEARRSTEKLVASAVGEFAAGRYRKAFELYSRVPDEDMSPLSRKRMAIASRNCGLKR